ncbi:MAG: hypothetical protein ACRDCG_00080 [Mycoplasmoidaceae bacterium]
MIIFESIKLGVKASNLSFFTFKIKNNFFNFIESNSETSKILVDFFLGKNNISSGNIIFDGINFFELLEHNRKNFIQLKTAIIPNINQFSNFKLNSYINFVLNLYNQKKINLNEIYGSNQEINIIKDKLIKNMNNMEKRVIIYQLSSLINKDYIIYNDLSKVFNDDFSSDMPISFKNTLIVVSESTIDNNNSSLIHLISLFSNSINCKVSKILTLSENQNIKNFDDKKKKYFVINMWLFFFKFDPILIFILSAFSVLFIIFMTILVNSNLLLKIKNSKNNINYENLIIILLLIFFEFICLLILFLFVKKINKYLMFFLYNGSGILTIFNFLCFLFLPLYLIFFLVSFPTSILAIHFLLKQKINIDFLFLFFFGHISSNIIFINLVHLLITPEYKNK